jgi:hypothetical protein
MKARVIFLSALMIVSTTVVRAADVEPLIQQIRKVSKEGAGNTQAAKAWRQLVQAGPSALLPILMSLNADEPEAANWLRSAADAITERELAAGRPLPVKELESFTMDSEHEPRARRLAYECLCRVDKTTPQRLLPGMLQDSSVELRRDAVAVVIKEAKQILDKQDKPAATAAYKKALAAARDKDQVDEIAKQLKALSEPVDLAAHFGFIKTWQLAGPFDNTDGKGFAVAYPPEKGVDLAAVYEGKEKAQVRWKEHTTSDAYGMVDLNKAIAKHMGATGYAFAAVETPAERPVELRVGSNNSVKIFLNGKLLLQHEEYHHGTKMDQYVAKGVLNAGRNEILIKVCQNEQKDDWAQTWGFQLRVCDSVGTAVALKKS